ncbi:MAG: hypothetical protein HZA54_11885 [Planctomycetes bacterium]|nr:hypothetical protein [Planctomycetota bacterium]
METTGRVRAAALAATLVFLVSAALPAGVGGGGAGTAAAEEAILPPADAFARVVVEVMKAYPTDGTHDYYWPKGDNWPGTTCDLVYRGVKVLEADPKGRCYCCGLTFEVFVKAWQKWCAARKAEFRIGDLSGEELLKLRADWFGSTGDTRRTLQAALVSRGLGRAVEKLKDARPGDFVQFWRTGGSGHSVVFLEAGFDSAGAPTKLKYWSTQKATRGIGVREERFGGEGGVKPDEVYVVRAGR